MAADDIRIYRNITSKTYSLRFKGRVIDHSRTLYVVRPTFSVSLAGNARVRRTGHKNVHAYVISENDAVQWPCPFIASYGIEGYKGWRAQAWRKVVYNPHKHTSFVLEDTGERVYYAAAAFMNDQGVYVIEPGN